MGHDSVVSGFIKIRDHQFMEQAQKAINSFEFDSVWPFTNIFWCDSAAQYSFPVIGFVGSYNKIEEVWSEWLWKFGQLLSQLDAFQARVNLDCILGVYSWELRPRAYCLSATRPPTMINQSWIIVSAPENDFSIDPQWLKYVNNNLARLDKETGNLIWYRWDKFLERMPGVWHLE